VNLKVVLKKLLTRFEEKHIDCVLCGGLALSTMGVFRLTKDIDLLVDESSKQAVDEVMAELGYEKQDFSSNEIVSYLSPLKVFGQVDFILARRRYTRAMMRRAGKHAVFDGEMEVKTLLPEDLIGLKVQAISNDPTNRYPIDAADIQNLLALHKRHMDMAVVREYFRIFDKEAMLDEWLKNSE
jgi:predicted nucleotidyltransferase